MLFYPLSITSPDFYLLYCNLPRSLQRARKASQPTITPLYTSANLRRRHTLCDAVLYEQLPGASYRGNRALNVIAATNDRFAAAVHAAVAVHTSYNNQLYFGLLNL